jgi:TPP-dependent 2-oxoacid decarboxylase
MLISMPTDTSTIFGVFQAIWLSLGYRTHSVLGVKVARIKKFAS